MGGAAVFVNGVGDGLLHAQFVWVGDVFAVAAAHGGLQCACGGVAA